MTLETGLAGLSLGSGEAGQTGFSLGSWESGLSIASGQSVVSLEARSSGVAALTLQTRQAWLSGESSVSCKLSGKLKNVFNFSLDLFSTVEKLTLQSGETGRSLRASHRLSLLSLETSGSGQTRMARVS